MKKNIFLLSIVLLAGVIISISCKKEISKKTAPTANAGPDHEIVLPTDTVLLDGSASVDPDGTIISYLWTSISLPFSQEPLIESNTKARSVARGLEAGTYKFVLKVTDNDGFFGFDTIDVTVITSLNSHWRRLALPPVCGQTFILGIDADNVFVGESFGHAFWKYNNQLNSWSQKQSYPFQESHLKTVNFSVNGNGYVGMGFYESLLSGGDSIDNRMSEYSPITDQWTQKNNAPVSGGATPLVINGFVYLVKGHSVWKYDPVTDTYEQKNNFPGNNPDGNTINYDSASVSFTINGEGYLVSGSDCWKYDPSTDNWQQKAGLPDYLSVQGGFSLNNYGYALADSSSTSYHGHNPLQLWQYDPMQNQWVSINDNYFGSGALLVKAASMNGIVFVGFGYNSYDEPFEGLSCDFWKFQ